MPREPSFSEYSLAIPTRLVRIDAFAIGRRGFAAATSWAVSTFVVAATNASAAAAAKNAAPALKRRYARIRFGFDGAVFMVWVRGGGIGFNGARLPDFGTLGQEIISLLSKKKSETLQPQILKR